MQRKSVYILVGAVAILIVIGCVMLFSTAQFSEERIKDPAFFIKRQGVWLAIGALAGLLAANIDYHRLQKTWAWWFAGALLLLALCFVPHIGMKINGSRRWLNLGVASFQPSELAKLATISALAWWFAKPDTDARSFVRGFLAPIGITLLPLSLIAPEVDMGTTALIGTTMMAMMFIAGTRFVFIAPIIVISAGGLFYAATHMQQRLGRLLAFRDLDHHKLGAGLQQWRGQLAFITGGVEGLGLGNGRQKHGYLPEAHTDFIFPMIGEELGLRCTLLIVACYLVIILCGMLIAMNARDRFGMLLGFGIVVILALQAAVNIGVTTALLPNKGLPLPFVSYGGSNLLFCLLCIGILINIYRQGLTEKETSGGKLLRARTGGKKLMVRI